LWFDRHQFNCDSLGIVVIVSVTRGDLREEFNMANDAFALSPLSARAAQPSEQDYEAISEAFMETARGRWFLGEYAKRNRNADTRMVLDAVERIEQSLAAQKIPEPEQVPDTSLADALTVIKAAVTEARTAAEGAVDELALNTHLSPLRKGARVIREISWRWREIGADSRICDLIDSQVGAIEASCAQLALADPHAGLQSAFALIDRAVAAFDETGAAEDVAATGMAPLPDPDEVAAEVASPVTEAAASFETPAAVAEPEVETAAAESFAAGDEQPVTVDDTPDEAAESKMDAVATEMAATADDSVAEVTPEVADAQDEALLDMVAAEMGAPDLSDDSEYYKAALAEAEAAEMQELERLAARPAAEARLESTPSAMTMVTPSEPTPLPGVYPSLQPALERAAEPALTPAPEPSLGSTLIANGLVGKPTPANDPLAALRRLSQVEKIALFS
jgi:hypothetical protein